MFVEVKTVVIYASGFWYAGKVLFLNVGDVYENELKIHQAILLK